MLVDVYRKTWLSNALCVFALFALMCTQAASGHNTHSGHTKHADKDATRGTIYFVDITVETFVPVSPNTIKRDADKVVFLDADDLAIFYSIIRQSGSSGRFISSHVRLRLDDGKKPPLFIDQQGVVISGHSQYSLTPLAFVELDHFIASLPSRK